MTIQAYQSLYESSIAYGMRKALIAECLKTEMQNNITNLRSDCEKLESEVERLEQKMMDTVKDDNALTDKEVADHTK